MTQYFTTVVTFQICLKKKTEKYCITPLINKSSKKYIPRSYDRLCYKIISQIIVYLREYVTERRILCVPILREDTP